MDLHCPQEQFAAGALELQALRLGDQLTLVIVEADVGGEGFAGLFAQDGVVPKTHAGRAVEVEVFDADQQVGALRLPRRRPPGVHALAGQGRAEQMEAGIQQGGMEVVGCTILRQATIFVAAQDAILRRACKGGGKLDVAHCFPVAPPDMAQPAKIRAELQSHFGQVGVIRFTADLLHAARFRLSDHAQTIVHLMCGGLYRAFRRKRRRAGDFAGGVCFPLPILVQADDAEVVQTIAGRARKDGLDGAGGVHGVIHRFGQD